MTMVTRFVVCGEALIDLVPTPVGTESSEPPLWRSLSAGGPMNTAVALARLGATPQFLGRFSSDVFGHQLRTQIDGAAGGTELAVESPQATSTAVINVNSDGAADYTFQLNDTANFGWRSDDLPHLRGGDWLHLGSLACVHQSGGRRVTRVGRGSEQRHLL